VQPGVLERDGQAEPGPAGGARPRRVGPPEPVEHHLLLGRAEADAVVADRDRHRVPVPRDGDHHVAPLAVLDRVVQQIPQDALHPAAVYLGDAWFRRQPEVDPGAAPGGQLLGVRGRPPDQVAHVGRLRVQRGRVGVVPADFQQVSEEGFEPIQLALQQLRGPGRGRQQVLPPREQHVGRDPDRGERGA
jgi:hypothetical protein